MSARRDKMLTLDALKMAIARRGDVNDLYVTPRSRDGIPNGRVSSTVARLSNHLQHEPQGARALSITAGGNSSLTLYLAENTDAHGAQDGLLKAFLSSTKSGV